MKANIWIFVIVTWDDGDVSSAAYGSDGEEITGHISSNVEFAKWDMGITSERKHDRYQAAYPEGYELHWIDDVRSPDNPQEFKDMLAMLEAEAAADDDAGE